MWTLIRSGSQMDGGSLFEDVRRRELVTVLEELEELELRRLDLEPQFD